MLGNIGLPTLIFIVLIALLFFGPSKLPELGRALGKTMREFKKGASEMMDDEEDNKSNKRKEVSDSTQKSTRDDSDDNKRLPD